MDASVQRGRIWKAWLVPGVEVANSDCRVNAFLASSYCGLAVCAANRVREPVAGVRDDGETREHRE
jgi:hypothetical protein